MSEIILEKRYPHSRSEDITDAFMRGYVKGKADRLQGEWIVSCIDGIKQTECSVCGESSITYDVYGWNYCPWCGAEMKGADDGNK